MPPRDRELYVYAIAGPGLPRSLRVHGRRLRTMTVGSADIIVEERRTRSEPTTEALQEQHAIAVELAGRARALLPARFGSLIAEERLRATISERQPEILRALALVGERQQFTVRVFGPLDETRPVIDRGSSGTAFLESRRAQVRHEPAEVATIRRVLSGVPVSERVEVGQGHGLRVTVFHLVDRTRAHGYLARAATLQLQLEPYRGTVTGPWPAFAFTPELF